MFLQKSVTICQATVCSYPKANHLHLHCHKNFKAHETHFSLHPRSYTSKQTCINFKKVGRSCGLFEQVADYLIFITTHKIQTFLHPHFSLSKLHLGNRLSFGFFNPEVGTNRLSRNVGKKLPLLTAQQPRRSCCSTHTHTHTHTHTQLFAQ